MNDPTGLSDEQAPQRFKKPVQRMGPEDPMDTLFRQAEAGDQSAADQLERMLTMPGQQPSVQRSRNLNRLRKIKGALPPVVGDVGSPQKVAPIVPQWVTDKESGAVSLLDIEDALGELTGGLRGEGLSGEGEDTIATKGEREAMDRGYGIGAAVRSLAREYLRPEGGYTIFGPDSDERKAMRADLIEGRNFILDAVVPGVVDDLESGKSIDYVRKRLRKSNVVSSRYLGEKVDAERRNRHMRQRPQGVSAADWAAKFEPFAGAFISAEDRLAEEASALGELSFGEDLGNNLLNAAGFTGAIIRNVALSDMQDDFQKAAQLVRDGKPIPQDLADRIIQFKMQSMRQRSQLGGMLHDFTTSAGFVVDQYLGGKFAEGAVKMAGKALGLTGRVLPQTLGQVARGFGVAGDDVVAQAMKSSPFFKAVGDKIGAARFNTRLAMGAERAGVGTVGTKAVSLGADVTKAVGAAAGQTAATAAGTGVTSLARQGDLSEARMGRAGVTALERSMAEELQVGLDPDQRGMVPVFSASEEQVDDSATFADLTDTVTEYVSEMLGRYIPILGTGKFNRDQRRRLAQRAVRGTASKTLRGRVNRLASGVQGAVPIDSVPEELAEEYLKRGLDKGIGLLTGDETLSQTEIVGGAEQVIDELVRVSLNTTLMGATRQGLDFATTRPSERRRIKLYESIRDDLEIADQDPAAAARVEDFLRKTRKPNAEDMAGVMQALDVRPVDMESLSEEARLRLRDFERDHGVLLIPVEGSVDANGAFSTRTPGVAYIDVNTVNEQGEFERATPEILQGVATHEVFHDGAYLLGERGAELVATIKERAPELWEASRVDYRERIGEEEFAQLTAGEQTEETAANIAEDNAVLIHALSTNPQVAKILQDAGAQDRTVLEAALVPLRRLLRFDLTGRSTRQRAEKRLSKLLGADVSGGRAVASYDIFNIMQDAIAVRSAIRQNASKSRFEGLEGLVPDEQLELNPREFQEVLDEMLPEQQPRSAVAPQEAALASSSLIPGVQQLQEQARAEGVEERPAAVQEALPEQERQATEGVIEDSTEFQVRNAEQAGRRLAVLRERLSAYAAREGRTARDRRIEASLREEIADIERRYPDAPVVLPEADLGLELEVAAEQREQRAAAQAEADAQAAQQREAEAEEAVRESTRMETDAPDTPVTEGTRVRVQGQARIPRVAEEFEGPRRGAAVLDDGQRVQRRELMPLGTAMPVSVGATVRVRPGTPTQGKPRKTRSEQPLEVVRLTGPIGNQRAKLSDGRIVAVEGLRVVDAGPDATELAPDQLRQAQKAREDAMRGRTRFSPRTKGLRRGSGRERHNQGPRQEFALSSAVSRGKAKKFDTLETHGVVGMDGVPRVKDGNNGYNVYELIADEARRMLGAKAANMSDEQVIRGAERYVVNNLLWLYDNYAEYRDRAKEWYNGANRIATDIAQEFGVEQHQAAAALAALSPQKDWDMNVQLARYIARALQEVPGTRATPAMIAWMRDKDSNRPEEKRAKDESVTAQAIGAYDDIAEAPEAQAKYIRAYIETSYDMVYPQMSPEGETQQLANKADGTPEPLTFGNYNEIANGIRALSNASMEVIDGLFNGHKVRSFYNNILYPDGDWGDTTIDTHAVAGAEMMPYGAGHPAVLANFGSKGAAAFIGMKGTYPFYATAFRVAAQKRGVLPREMQSITWEAARGMMDGKKGRNYQAQAQAIWDNWRDGKISQPEALRRVNTLFGGIPAPRWAQPSAGGAEAEGRQEDVSRGRTRPGRDATRRSPRSRKLGAASSEVSGASDSVRRDDADANGVVPVVEGAERNKNFQKFIRRTKVRDDKGKPLVVYHGTKSPNDFRIFDRTSDIGYHFGTQEQAQSSRFIGWPAYDAAMDRQRGLRVEDGSESARVYPVYLDIRNPLIMPDLGMWPANRVVPALQRLSGDGAKAAAREFARSDGGGTSVSGRMLKAFKPIPETVVEDIINELDTYDGNNWETVQPRRINVKYMEIIRKHLANAGYDGIVYVNEAEGDKEAPSYIAFSPHQVKSIHNKGTFDATDPDIRMSPRRRKPTQVMDRFDMPEMSGFEQFQANWANRLLRAEQFEDYLAQGGIKVVGDESAVSMMKRMPGRLRSGHEDLTTQFQQPIVDIMKRAQLTTDEVDDYLIARHTKEANRALAERRGLAQQMREQAREIREFYNDETDPDIKRDKMREASNLEARADKIDTREDAVSFLTDAEADQRLAEMRQSGNWAELEKLGKLIDDMNAETRRRLLAGGLISQDQFDTWERIYEHYVPFRTNEINRHWSESSGYQDAKPVTQYRQGRMSKPNPLVFSFQQARSAINRSEKNKIGQRFVELLERGNQIAEKNRALEGEAEPDWKSEANAYSFSYKEDGNQMVVRIRDKELARVVKNMDAAELGQFMSTVNRATRVLSNLNTQYNPAFLVPNAIRDSITVGVIAGELKDQGWEVSRAAMARDSLRAINAQLRPGSSAEMDDFIRRYREAGGQIGWSDATDFETISANIEDALERAQNPTIASTGARYLKAATAGWIEPLNLAVEQATRIAVFKASVEAGMSDAEAAVTAREITVDFNRRGYKMHYINSMYMFFNAGVQGTLRSVKALTNSDTVKATAVGGIIMGFFEDIMMAGLSDEDEDGRLEWDNEGAWSKYMNLHLPGGYKIPLPYFWNLFPATGQVLGQLYRGVTTPDEAALSLAGAAFDSMSPLTVPEASWEGAALGLTPSILRPVVENLTNMDYQGRPIYLDPFPGQYKQDSHMNPSSGLSSVTKALFKWTGGDVGRKPGAMTIDVNPAALQHLMEQYGGGAFGEIIKALDVDMNEPNRWPVVRRFYGKPNPYGVSSNFYELREEEGYAAQAIRDARKAGNREEVARLRADYRSVLRVSNLIKGAHKAAQELSQKISAETDSTRRQELIAERDRILGAVVNRYDELESQK